MWPHHKKEIEKLDCGWEVINDEMVLVHRFDLGSYTCRCGVYTVEQVERRGGWKAYSKNKNEPKQS
jgi:hypothetical protein